MSAKVDLDRLAEALIDYPYGFLLTVGDDYRPHTVMVEPVLSDGVIDVGPVGDRTANNVANHAEVTIVWPPREPGGYALMVDGRAEPGADEGGLTVVPSKALLHRKAAPGSAAADSGCLHDCVVFKA